MRYSLFGLCILLGVAGTAAAAPIRIAGVGANLGNQAANSIPLDIPGSTVARINEATFNGMTPAQLRTNYDVLIITWASSSTLNVDWATRLLPFLNAGGGVIYEDPNNLADIAAITNASSVGGGSSTVIATVPGLTDGITNNFANNHIRFNSWASWLFPFLELTGSPGFITGLYGDVPGGGRIILTGPDQDFHGLRNGGGSGANQYNLLLNSVQYVSLSSVPEPVSMIVFGSLVVGGIVAVRRRMAKAAA